jgi:hypothetical protein
MRWRLTRVAVPRKTWVRRGPVGRVRLAVVGSLAAHLVLAWVFFSNKATRPVLPPDTVKIDIDVPGTIEAITASAEEPTGIPATTGALAARGNDLHQESKRSSPGAAEATAPAACVQAPSTASVATGGGDSPDGEVNRLATFQPAHPNLNGPMHFPAPEEKPRDLLAPPTTKERIPPHDELPKVIRGSGNVTANVAEDGSIRIHSPGVIGANKLPLYTFGDGLEDGSDHFSDPGGIAKSRSPFSAFGEGVRVGVSGHLDVTDLAMKLAGQDPYSSSKRAIIDETREQRFCMAKRFQDQQKKQELFTLATRVRRLATRVDLSAAERRELVFAIWDECSEESDSTTDYNAMARATILSIVREAFPAGSDRAYQPAELLALNDRRSSHQRFAPYDPSPMARAHHPEGGASAECP